MKARGWAWLLLLPALVVISGLGTAAAMSVRRGYQVTDLGTLGGGESFASAVNNRGQVVGRSRTADGEVHAFIWEQGVIRDLGTLGGDNSFAAGINRHGHVVGSAEQVDGVVRAVIWKSGTIRDLGILPRGTTSDATGINRWGEIVGSGDMVISNRYGEFGVERGFLWRNGRMRILPEVRVKDRADPSPLSNRPLAINDHGTIVGVHQVTDEWPGLWRSGPQHHARLLVRSEGAAHAINQRNHVVGSYGHGELAFVWKEGHLRQLPGGPNSNYGVALGINDRGEIVGHSASGAIHWYRGRVSDLNTLLPEGSGWHLHAATAINQHGQIVGSGRHEGEDRAFLLTPNSYRQSVE